jgi:hypothetical protein
MSRTTDGNRQCIYEEPGEKMQVLQILDNIDWQSFRAEAAFDLNDLEKAKEIANDDTLYGEDPDNNSIVEECYIAELSMARWKNEQLSKCLENLEKEYIKNSGKGLYDNNEIAAKLATLKRIEEEIK